MKALIYSIYIVFFCLIVVTFIVAFKSYDGLVEDNYYEKSANYIGGREWEEKLDFRVTYPDKITNGKKEFTATLSGGESPFRGGRVSLSMGRIKGEGADLMFDLEEEREGTYSTHIGDVERGVWLCTLEIERGKLKTSRRWLMRVE